MNTVIVTAIMMVSMMLPLSVALVAVLWHKRQERQEARRSPLVDKLAHLPGEQLRRRMDVLSESIDGRLVELMMLGPATMMIVLLPQVQWASIHLNWFHWLLVVVALGLTLLKVRRLIPVWRERRQCKQGMLAEVATAQYLDRLQMQDCLVLHDIPAAKFNIDHVVIGPSAVFMVETKSRRKKGEGKASANVDYDGMLLKFPGWSETKPLEQARAQARWLAEYLRGETGDPVPVIPVVCLPGWFVNRGKDAHRSDVRVINPKMSSLFVELGNRRRLDPSHRNRIVTALYKRYPELDAD